MQGLADAFDRMLADVSPPAVVRAVEAGGAVDGLWEAVAASGFLDALVPGAAGGAGLLLGDACPLLIALGRHAVPAPLGETMLARAILAGAGMTWPDGGIVLATGGWPVPLAQVASHVLTEVGGELRLLAIADAQARPTGVQGDLSAWLSLGAGEALAGAAAVLRAAAIAGAADVLLERTVAYANERVQFGKPIGKQQAVQQQLAEMAELAVAARLAAELGCSAGLPPPMQLAAVAKQVAGANAARIAGFAHAVHGAIGISAEFDLQLWTRRLHQWRLADGGEGLWARALGSARLAMEGGSVDFVRGLGR
jgi:alkylation response protein AidB-like acyl-CoA dehydrogenase